MKYIYIYIYKFLFFWFWFWFLIPSSTMAVSRDNSRGSVFSAISSPQYQRKLKNFDQENSVSVRVCHLQLSECVKRERERERERESHRTNYRNWTPKQKESIKTFSSAVTRRNLKLKTKETKAMVAVITSIYEAKQGDYAVIN